MAGLPRFDFSDGGTRWSLFWFLTFWLFFRLWLLLLLRLRVVEGGRARGLAERRPSTFHGRRSLRNDRSSLEGKLMRPENTVGGPTQRSHWAEPGMNRNRHGGPHNEWFGKAFQFKLKPRNFISRAAQGSEIGHHLPKTLSSTNHTGREVEQSVPSSLAPGFLEPCLPTDAFRVPVDFGFMKSNTTVIGCLCARLNYFVALSAS